MVALISWCRMCTSSTHRSCMLAPPYLSKGSLDLRIFFPVSKIVFAFKFSFVHRPISHSVSLFLFICLSLSLPLSLCLSLTFCICLFLHPLSLCEGFLFFSSFYFKRRWEARRGWGGEGQRRRVLDRRALLWTNDSWGTSGVKRRGYQQAVSN